MKKNFLLRKRFIMIAAIWLYCQPGISAPVVNWCKISNYLRATAHRLVKLVWNPTPLPKDFFSRHPEMQILRPIFQELPWSSLQDKEVGVIPLLGENPGFVELEVGTSFTLTRYVGDSQGASLFRSVYRQHLELGGTRAAEDAEAVINTRQFESQFPSRNIPNSELPQFVTELREQFAFDINTAL